MKCSRIFEKILLTLKVNRISVNQESKMKSNNMLMMLPRRKLPDERLFTHFKKPFLCTFLCHFLPLEKKSCCITNRCIHRYLVDFFLNMLKQKIHYQNIIILFSFFNFSVATLSAIQPLIRSTSNSPSRTPASNTMSIQKPRKSKRTTPYTKRPAKANNDSRKAAKKSPDLNNQFWPLPQPHAEPFQEHFESHLGKHHHHSGQELLSHHFSYVPSLAMHRTWQGRLQNSVSPH